MTRLDRNTHPNGRGKYALIKLRELPDNVPPLRDAIIDALRDNPQALRLGNESPGSGFFVISLGDLNAARALLAYADACAENGDVEFAKEVRDLAWDSELLGDSRKMPE